MAADPHGGPGLPACIVIAEFDVLPAVLPAFDALARRFAQHCLDGEPGCRQFDVVALQSPAGGRLFYEAYDDDDAFAAHGRSPHLAAFQAAFALLGVAERPLRRGVR